MAIFGAVARDGLNTPVPRDYTKESQHASLALLPELTPPGGDVKKYQQAFLALLPGMACEQSYYADINLAFILKITTLSG